MKFAQPKSNCSSIGMDYSSTETGILRISLDLARKRTSIAIAWSILFLTSGLLPVVLYFGLRYGTSLKLSVGIEISSTYDGLPANIDISVGNPNSHIRRFVLVQLHQQDIQAYSQRSLLQTTGKWSLASK